jgi:hypothetical protein
MTALHLIVILLLSGKVLNKAASPEKNTLVNEKGNTIEARFLEPAGFKRIEQPPNSFGSYLRCLPLKKHGSPVLYYNGLEKDNSRNVHLAVVDMEIGNKDLQQCADAVMRLRAEYLFAQKQYDKIHFNFTNGFRCDYSKWKEGNRVVVSGNNVSWKKTTQASDSYADFRKYMDVVFMYAGSLSLSKELKKVDVKNIQPGDVFIRGGSPGHAVIVMDVSVNIKTGERLFMLAQSYMPAQETQILNNPSDAQLSPWYRINTNDLLLTPEWIFAWDELMRFEE